jgi:hypothetical protein
MATEGTMTIKQVDKVTIKGFQATVSGTVAFAEFASMFTGWHIELVNATTPNRVASWYQNRDGGMVTHINGRAIQPPKERQLSMNGVKYLVRLCIPDRNIVHRMMGDKIIRKGSLFENPEKASQFAQQDAQYNPELTMAKQFQHKGSTYYDSFMPGNPIHQILSVRFIRMTQYYEGMGNHIAALEEFFSNANDYCEHP